MLTIDAHTHAGEKNGNWSGDQIVANMKNIAIDKTIIFPFTVGTFDNEEVYQYAKQYPEQLIPFCSVNPWNGTHALEEVERCFRLGFKGLKLHPTFGGYHLSNPIINPLLEIVKDYGGVVIAHGTSDLYNNPLEFDRVARRFPSVPLIMAHCGYFWQCDLAVEVAMENENLYLESSRVPMYEIKNMTEKIGARKMIWGTDGPFCDYEWEVLKMERAVNKSSDYEQVMGKTVAEILGIHSK